MGETPITTRPATADDARAMVEIAAPGFESYAEFAPPGWRPPPSHRDVEGAADLLADPTTWALLALDDGRPVGHVAFTPARERAASEAPPGEWRERPLVAGMAHLWQLFVLPPWWGRGVAPLLHERGIAAMRSRGYARARLFTPAGQARARRFYERRGWTFFDQQFNSDFGLDLVEYRLGLTAAQTGSLVSDSQR